MKFRYINERPDPENYHVATADIRVSKDDVERWVAFGKRTSDAEEALLGAIPSTVGIEYLSAS
jgi:hypothetical protein